MYSSNDHAKEEDMGWACGMYGGEEKYVQSYGDRMLTQLNILAWL
jgi:hypothetical protein